MCNTYLQGAQYISLRNREYLKPQLPTVCTTYLQVAQYTSLLNRGVPEPPVPTVCTTYLQGAQYISLLKREYLQCALPIYREHNTPPYLTGSTYSVPYLPTGSTIHLPTEQGVPTVCTTNLQAAQYTSLLNREYLKYALPIYREHNTSPY